MGVRGKVNFFFFPPLAPLKKNKNKSNKPSLELSAVSWNGGTSFSAIQKSRIEKVLTDEVLETSTAVSWWGLVALFALEGSTCPAALIHSKYAVLWIWSWSPDFAGHRDFIVFGKSGVRRLNDSLLPCKSHSGAAVGWQQLWPLYFSLKLLCLAIANTARCMVRIPAVPRAVHLTAFFFFFLTSRTRGIVPPGDTWLAPHYLHGAHVHRLKLPDVMKGSIEVEI